MEWSNKQKAVKIAGMRRVLPNRKPVKPNPLSKIKEALNSLKFSTRQVPVESCIIEHADKLTIYDNTSLRIILGNKNNPMGYLVDGNPRCVKKPHPNDAKDIPEDFEAAVENIIKSKDEINELCECDADDHGVDGKPECKDDQMKCSIEEIKEEEDK
ncbi:hypothetical protein TCON_1813 [Astathelohania contejeani]|uniref:Uncharacterized protein n=1 Tax=Astathelohania contejeani TaxID=164912 RepID=A0ABQ7HXY2_9MICR|nr:hypothetical protein TCON_1813 [Thelohania contejeani]